MYLFIVDMSGMALLSRLALRPGLRCTSNSSTATGLRTLTASLSNKATFATPNAHLRAAVGVNRSVSKDMLFDGAWKGWGVSRMVSTSATLSQESATSVATGKKLRIAVIGQSMFGRDVSIGIISTVCQ